MARRDRAIDGKHGAAALVALLLGVLLSLPGVAAAREQSATATTWVVQDCDDTGAAGTLRAVIGQAASGDRIDLTQLSCHHISLWMGTLMVPQDDLTLIGPGRSALVLDARSAQGAHSRVLTHTGAGTLAISGMTIAHAAPLGTYGGCIDSFANVSLTDVVVAHCSVSSSGQNYALGGGAYAGGDIELFNSVVRDSHAVAIGTGIARGGGIYAEGDMQLDASVLQSNTAAAFQLFSEGGGAYVAGDLIMIDSQVLDNRAINPFSSYSYSNGGGLLLLGGFSIYGSTIANNYAPSVGGGLYSEASTMPATYLISDSTIASNHSREPPGGIYLLGWLALSNSTVAFNTSEQAPGNFGAVGIQAWKGLSMSSSIVAANTSQGVPFDIEVGGPIYGGAVTGSHNLIFAPGDTGVPLDTLVGQDPMLGALGYHGGPTLTLALLRGSPARDAGSNADGLSWDQRGAGFARVVGSAADIGAFESRPTTLSIAPPGVDFGGVPTLVLAPAVTVTLSNTGDGQVQISSLDAPEVPFYRVGGSCGNHTFTLYANASCSLVYTFLPTAAGTASQVLRFSTSLGPRQLNLSGAGVEGDVIFAADFGY